MKKIIRVIRNFFRYLKHGQVNEIKIAQIKYANILQGKKVLITGGCSGIGLAIAKKCLDTGAKVIITGRSDDKLNNIKVELNNDNLFTYKWDISCIKDIDQNIKEIAEILGGLDIVYNNAGIYKQINFVDVNEKMFDEIIDTNIKGLYFTAQGVSNYFLSKKQQGKIINIASIRGMQGATDPYGISKWGVVGLTKGLGRDLITKGIIVNGIAPGITATAINNIDVNNNAYYNDAKDQRVALPEEIAEIAIFLASDATNHIVGQVIVCDGGELLL